MQSASDERLEGGVSQEVERSATQLSEAERQRILDRAAGLWRDRDDLPDWRDLRRSWDRQEIDRKLKN